MEEFKRPGAAERVKQLGYLLKNTFTVVGRDRDILAPLYRMWVYATVLVSVFFAGVLAVGADADGRGALLIVVAAGLFVYKYFYYNRQELAQSWLVSETAGGRDRSFRDAKERVGELRSQARRLALLDMLAGWIASQRRSGDDEGVSGMLVNLVIAGLIEVWDLANHFLLPAVAADGLDLGEGVSRLRKVKDNVPETLVGVFGIDIMGRAVVTIMAPAYLLLAVVGVGGGLWLGDSVPAAFSAGAVGGLYPGELPAWMPVDAATTFTWLPLLVCVWLGKLAGSLFERAVTSVKVIYFTLFYVRILHPEALAPDIREELESYLKMEETEEGGEPLAARATAE